jgi:glutathione peroxidase
MRWSVLGLLLMVGCGEPRATEGQPSQASPAVGEVQAKKESLIDHEVRTLEGQPMSLAAMRGAALLIVNTASECGFTPQYAGLQALHERYEGKGLHVLAFPCNDFGGQEPGDARSIRRHLSETYQVTFPVFEKQRIKGTSAEKSPLWRTLTEETADGIRGEVKWNFTKFLVAPDGRVVARFGSDVDPQDPKVIAAIEKVLPKP